MLSSALTACQNTVFTTAECCTPSGWQDSRPPFPSATWGLPKLTLRGFQWMGPGTPKSRAKAIWTFLYPTTKKYVQAFPELTRYCGFFPSFSLVTPFQISSAWVSPANMDARLPFQWLNEALTIEPVFHTPNFKLLAVHWHVRGKLESCFLPTTQGGDDRPDLNLFWKTIDCNFCNLGLGQSSWVRFKAHVGKNVQAFPGSHE